MKKENRRKNNYGNDLCINGRELAWTTILGESGLQRWPEYQVLTDTSQRELLQLDNIQDILEFVQKFLQKTAIPR